MSATIKGAAAELGTERIRKLLVQYAVPAVIAMTAASLYNMVDSIFIGHGVGPLAISGLALTFPLMNLAAAFGSLVGVGAATLVSMRLGQRDYETAQNILGNVVVLNLIIGLSFGLVTLLFLDPILYFFGASDATIGYARDYMTIILLGNVITHMYLGLNSVLRASGHPRKSMYATIYTVVINAALDPLFIYGFGWGIRGAAVATILAQVIALVWQFHILSDKSELLHFRPGIYRLRRKIVRDILAIGMSPFLMNLAACFIVILINKGLKQYGGDLMIGAYGIVNRLAFFFVMIVMGINQGMQPIAGYNFGARQYERVLRVLKLTIIGATCVTMAGFLMGELVPRLAVSAFTNDPELIRLSVEGMRIVFICFPIIGFQMVATNFFMSIGMAGKAIFLSLSRQLLFLMPGLIFLPHIFDVYTRWDGSWGVWCSMPLSDLLASVVAFCMLAYQLCKFRAKMDAAPATNNPEESATMKDKFVINLGRQLGSGGKAVGEAVAARLGIGVYDKQLINLAAEQSGICPEIFEKADEKESRNLFATFIGYLRSPFVGSEYSGSNVLSSDALFKIQSDVIRDLASRESCVFVGRCADYILRDHPRTVNIFIAAGRAERIERLCRLHGIAPGEAESLMDRTDARRAAYYNYYSSGTWGMAETYDLCIDSSVLGIDGTTGFVLEFVERKLGVKP